MTPSALPRRTGRHRGRGGFTLVELLIVVAIIAILAAIAIPNFLEAQVRSKVTRVRADMRTLAVAIESYSSDFNGHHPIARQYTDGAGSPSPPWFNNRLHALTSPVVYIASLPPDVFEPALGVTPFVAGLKPTFHYEDASTAVSGLNHTPLPSDGYFENRSAYSLYFVQAGDVNWSLLSPGPDVRNDLTDTALAKPVSEANARMFGSSRTYDPTNGTVSPGDVTRTNAMQVN